MTDFIFILGAASITAGAAMIHGPVGFIVGGLFAVGFAVGEARTER